MRHEGESSQIVNLYSVPDHGVLSPNIVSLLENSALGHIMFMWVGTLSVGMVRPYSGVAIRSFSVNLIVNVST